MQTFIKEIARKFAHENTGASRDMLLDHVVRLLDNAINGVPKPLKHHYSAVEVLLWARFIKPDLDWGKFADEVMDTREGRVNFVEPWSSDEVAEMARCVLETLDCEEAVLVVDT